MPQIVGLRVLGSLDPTGPDGEEIAQPKRLALGALFALGSRLVLV